MNTAVPSHCEDNREVAQLTPQKPDTDELVASVLGVSHKTPAPVTAHGALVLAVIYTTPVTEYVPALAGTYAAPVDDYVAPAPFVTNAASAPVTEYVPAPAVTYTAPAPAFHHEEIVEFTT